MMSLTHHPLVADYLTRLRLEAARLPAPDARELLGDIDEHLRAAAGDGCETEADVRNLLDRLGSPEEVVTAAMPALPRQDPPRAEGGNRKEVAAVLLFLGAEFLALTIVGILFAVVAWIVAAILMGGSPRWTRREKRAGFLVLGTGTPLAFAAALASTLTFRTRGPVCVPTAAGACSDAATTAGRLVPILLAMVVIACLGAQVLTAIRLLRAASRS